LNHAFLPFGVALLAATVVATAATAAAVAPALAPAATALLLAFGRGGNVSSAGNGVGLDLVVGFGHGESRDQN
jgi:hypothetical protein